MRQPRRRCEPRAPLGLELRTRSRARAHASAHPWQAGLEAAEKKRVETAELLRLTAAELKAVKELLAAKEEAKKINNTATNEAEVITIEATEKAAETKYAFETEAALYKQIKSDNFASVESILQYMANRLIEENERPVNAMMSSPVYIQSQEAGGGRIDYTK